MRGATEMQNKDDTKQLRRDISLELKIHINSGQKPEFEHQMHNHLPNQEEHKDHVIEEECRNSGRERSGGRRA